MSTTALHSITADLRLNALGRALGVVALTLVLKAALDLMYLGLVSVRYESDGYLMQFSPLRVLGSYLLAVAFTLALNSLLRRGAQPASIVVCFYVVFVALPLLTLYGTMEVPTGFVLAVLGCVLLVAGVQAAVPVLRLRPPSPGVAAFTVLAAALVTLYVYVSLMRGGVGRFNLDLYQVYEARAELAESRFPLMGYLLPLQGYVINMAVLVYALGQRRWWLVIAVLGVQVLLFGLTNFKAFLFAPLLVVGLYVVVKRRNPLLLMLAGAIAMVLLLIGLDAALGEIMFGSILVRLFYTPALLHHLYYDFFSANPLMFMSDGRLSFLFENPYDMPYIHVVALEYWGKVFSPNVGFLGDAYANFGLMGMFLFSVFLGLFLKLIDSVSILTQDRNMAVAMVAIPGFALVNSALFTSLLTHGLLATLVALWLLSRVSR